MSSNSDLARAMSDMMDNKIFNGCIRAISCRWNSAEAEDANLSNITGPGDQTYRYIPKLSGVTPSAAGNVIVLVVPGLGMFIVGVLVGDARLTPQIPLD